MLEQLQSFSDGGLDLFVAANAAIGAIFLLFYSYQFFYIPIPHLLRDRPLPEGRKNRLGIMISARNESAVIGELIDSLNRQTFPREQFEIFVVADNCTDNTAEICRSRGAIVFERFDQNKIGKGYALNFLYKKIVGQYGADAFEAFLVLDADNILSSQYLEEMNKTFSAGYEVCTSLRNSKNYGDNWISAGYALWFLRESEYLNHPRMLLGTSCAVSGTGFLFSSKVIREADGWNFFLLTEDIEFSVYNILKGRKIGYAKNAELFDEQPVTFAQSWRQRLRWAKGYFQVWGHYGCGLLKNIFSPQFTSCYDMTMTIMPALILTLGALGNFLVGAVFAFIFGWQFSVLLESLLFTLLGMYFTLWLIGAITTVSQWRRIYCSSFKKIFYTFTFPLFMLTYVPIALTAMFKKVGWKPIAHTRVCTLEQIRKN
ncbi:MAG: glycosyltransferase family 2 protein [Opitutales bacterium]|nr:glycosyltransferase family 2 protein [Opitutales bacterium]